MEVPKAPLAGDLLSQGGLSRGSTGSARDGGAGARRPLCPGAAAAAGGRGEETEDRGCGRRPGGASPWRGFALAGRLRGGLAPLLGALMMGQFTEMWFGTRQDLFLVFSQPVPGGRWVPREGAVRAGPMSPGGVAAGHSQEHTWQEATCVLWPSDLPCVLAMLATFTRYLALLSPALTPARGHQSPPGERDGVLFPSSLLPSG